MSRVTVVGFALLLALAGCRREKGERCNPLEFNVDDQCTNGLACLYPANCGVAFCCPPSDMLTTTVPMCTFAPACSGGSCCGPAPPETGRNTATNCDPCAAPDAGTD
jgi:hypothetical protein